MKQMDGMIFPLPEELAKLPATCGMICAGWQLQRVAVELLPRTLLQGIRTVSGTLSAFRGWACGHRSETSLNLTRLRQRW
jgi:hypothetical protein